MMIFDKAFAIEEPTVDNYIVDDNGCWIWQGQIDALGYGKIYSRDKVPIRAHRVFWTIHRGAIPKGLSVLHKCDVRSCVNPDHLFLGTQQDNMDDMKAKGKWPGRKGIANGRAWLSEDQVIEIFTLIDEGRLFNYEIAELYGVAPTTISYIKNKGWRHLKENK